MDAQKHFAPWVQNALGVVLGTAILGIGFAAWNDRALDARRDERIKQIEASLIEFRKPGKRYSQSDGDRDRDRAHREMLEIERDLTTLRTNFYKYRNSPSKAAPEIEALSNKIDDCHKISYDNAQRWVECKTSHAKVESQLFFLQKTLETNGH